MAELAVSLAMLGATVLLSEAARRAGRHAAPYLLVLEAASTFQLCLCTHEQKLLGESGQVDLPVSVTLTYIVTLIHVLSFRGASCNPIGTVERVYRGSYSAKAAAGIIAAQFAGGVAAQVAAASVWSLGLSALHLRHQRFGFRCFDPLGGTVVEAAAVELACAFVVQAVVLHIHKVDEKLRAYTIAAVITTVIYSGASISGAIFNPVLAFSIQFPCSGHTYLEYCFVYWLGPLLGVVSCILLFEKIIPFLSGKSTVALDAPVVQKKKTQ